MNIYYFDHICPPKKIIYSTKSDLICNSLNCIFFIVFLGSYSSSCCYPGKFFVLGSFIVVELPLRFVGVLPCSGLSIPWLASPSKASPTQLDSPQAFLHISPHTTSTPSRRWHKPSQTSNPPNPPAFVLRCSSFVLRCSSFVLRSAVQLLLAIRSTQRAHELWRSFKATPHSSV